jgi:hypothetical protein
LKRRSLSTLAALFAALPSCAPRSAAVTAQPDARTESGELAELMPLVDGTVSSFVTEDDLGQRGSFVLEISRPRPDVAELAIAGKVQRLLLSERAVDHAAGGSLLALPLERGRTFRGSFGEVTILETGASIEVPAGLLTRCVQTREESRKPARRVDSWYCPGVGLARFVVSGSGAKDALSFEALLVSHGPRVDFAAPSP